jgi:hypothetical protein
VGDEKKQNCVAEQPDRAIEERGTAQSKCGSDVHGIADIPIRTSDYQLARWIKRRWRSTADEGKRQDAPQSNRPANHSHNDTGKFNCAKLGWANDPGSFQNPPRHENQQQADEERCVGNGPGENERGEPPEMSMDSLTRNRCPGLARSFPD